MTEALRQFSPLLYPDNFQAREGNRLPDRSELLFATCRLADLASCHPIALITPVFNSPRFPIESRGTISTLVHKWAKTAAFQEPTRLLKKVNLTESRLKILDASDSFRDIPLEYIIPAFPIPE
jgi:hypothetical protein